MERRKISKEVYDKIIKQIPNKIIEMLPDKPENLLRYATRIKEVQFSKNVDEPTKKLMKEKLLSDEEYLRTFFFVMAITFYNKKRVENPQIKIVAAQTGSGKSNLTAKLLREDENYIFVDSDKYKHFRYDAKVIANEYQVLYPFLTGPDGYDHTDNIYEYAIANKYNIIKESAPSKNKGLLNVDAEELLKNNYKISVYILAVGELNSLLSVHERYELQIIHGLKTAKLTSIGRHDESYEALIPNVKEIIDDKRISRINVYIRGNLANEYNPTQIFPSERFCDIIEALKVVREEDNDNTKKEFKERYELVHKQMEARKAPKEQFEQLEEIYRRSIK